jgi:hypothetical protein
MRDIVPVVARLRAKSAADPRIKKVVRLFLALDPVAKREVLNRIGDTRP